MSYKNKYKDKNTSIEKNTLEKQVIGVVGLGYVGLPVAIGFSKKYRVIGYDINKTRIDTLLKYDDYTGQISGHELKESLIEFTTDEKILGSCNYIIVTVPTPISDNKEPDLTYLKDATSALGKNLTKGTIVVYESTVYPGATEEICIPILEEESRLVAGNGFYVGYSPERINPGDKEHTFQTINKVVAAQDEQTLEKIYNLYQSVIIAKVFKASTIKVAEASKILENTQRDINIALMNEISIIFNKLDINTYEVIEAASTKWNFTPFYPGLVGGHCIGVDPYYLIHKSKTAGYNPRFLSSARDINDYMPEYIVKSLLEQITLQKLNIKDLVITILGITFKQNIPDIRNSKALEIVTILQKMGLSVQVCDPHVQSDQFNKDTVINLREMKQLEKADVLILAVPHNTFTSLHESTFPNLLKDSKGIIMDIKGALTQTGLNKNIILWKL